MEIRQQGIENWQTGDLTLALEHFRQSWALPVQSYQRDRSDHSVFFELGQAEYWIGQTYMDQGELAEAENSFMIGFFFPVVPDGEALIRVQVSAAQKKQHLDLAVQAFVNVGTELGIL